MKHIKLIVICVLAAGANIMLNLLVYSVLQLPLFLDTLFTCAVAFAAGTLPGLFTALLTGILSQATFHSPLWIHLFGLCTIAEILAIRIFRSVLPRRDVRELDEYSLIGTVSPLLLLYISICMIVSILGGFIDFTTRAVLHIPDYRLFPLTFFKLGLLRNGLPLLVVDILSRIPVNMVDRFIVAFGGYGLGLLLHRIIEPRHTAGRYDHPSGSA
jgi:hypothetical protein